MYELEVRRVADEINERKAQRVLLQLPDGLRPIALSLLDKFNQLTKAEIILSGDSCYGACDLALSQAEGIGVDLIIHYAHNQLLPDTKIPTIYVDARMNYDISLLVGRSLEVIGEWNAIGLASTTQHVHTLTEISSYLKKVGKTPLIGSGTPRTPYNGQVLGCDYTTALKISDTVDGYLFIGAGKFHPIGLAITTGKSVVIANPYTMKVTKLGNKDIMIMAKKRMAAITQAKQSLRLGIIVSEKPGQFHMEAASIIKKKLSAIGKRGYIIYLNEVGTFSLGNFTEVEAYVDTACPRIAIDGIKGINVPILTLAEVEILLGEAEWEEIWGRSYLTYQSQGL